MVMKGLPMKLTLYTKMPVVLLIGVLCHSPLYATCSKYGCDIGPTIPCEQLLYNNAFNNTDCNAWLRSSSVVIVTEPSSYALFSGASSGSLQQRVFVPTGYFSHEIT